MTMDKKRALMLRMGLLALGDFKKADDTALAYVPDTRSVPNSLIVASLL